MSESINNKIISLMEIFNKLQKSTKIDIIIKESIIDIEYTMIKPSTNQIYILDTVHFKKILHFVDLSFKEDRKLYFQKLIYDNELFGSLFRKRNKFKNKLIDILEKEILNG